jgi:hypothetical protein
MILPFFCASDRARKPGGAIAQGVFAGLMSGDFRLPPSFGVIFCHCLSDKPVYPHASNSTEKLPLLFSTILVRLTLLRLPPGLPSICRVGVPERRFSITVNDYGKVRGLQNIAVC